jgi:hypothetical protein
MRRGEFRVIAVQLGDVQAKEGVMATEKDFAAADWQRIEAAPFMAGLAISYGDLSSKVGIAAEAKAAGEAITAGSSSASEIVRTIAARFAHGQRPTLAPIPNKPAEAQAALIDGCKAALALVAGKAPGEANDFARFLLDVARGASGAAREGGFIGVGIKKVSEGEERALASLALALGVPG